jgi:hypothetical protein
MLLRYPLILAAALLATMSAEAADSAAPARKIEATPAAAVPAAPNACVTRCEKAESACSSQVRRARADCSKKAANNGRDPMLMRRDYSAYFCGYFGNDHCGRDSLAKDCRSRFSRRHGLCVDTIQDNIAAQRYDCFLNERDAQAYCRDELRDCKQECGER